MYKTLVLQLLRQRPKLHDYLKKSGTLLQAMELKAMEVKGSHEAYKVVIGKMKPGSDPSQVAAEALELAVKDLEDIMPNEIPMSDEPISLDLIMAHLRGKTPPG
ncbi:MAG TPA: hypothetical protein VHR66_31690 [Gemmataceae bacterium]|nr:hypothetical protein [Gemmataceae bacterium]